jgi:hypothetical protein
MSENSLLVNISGTPSGTLFTRCFWYSIISVLTTDDQVKLLLHGYCQELLARTEIQEVLGISKSRFFALLKEYRRTQKLSQHRPDP